MPAAVLALLTWMIATGRARLRPLPLALFAAVAVVAVLSALVAVNSVDTRLSGVSAPSCCRC